MRINFILCIMLVAILDNWNPFFLCTTWYNLVTLPTLDPSGIVS